MKRKLRNNLLIGLLVILTLIAAPATAVIQGKECLVTGLRVSAYLSKNDAGLTEEKVYAEMNEKYKKIYNFVSDSSISVDSQAVPATSGYSVSDDDIDAFAGELTASCDTDSQKAWALYNWIITNIYYDYDYYEGRKTTVYRSASDTFKYRYTVCEGYASLYVAMCRSVGVPCRKVEGLSVSASITKEELYNKYFANEETHAWNEVYLDGKWYVVDATWDSGNEYTGGEFYKNDRIVKYYKMDFDEFSKRHMGMTYEDTFSDTEFDYTIDKNQITAKNYKGTKTDITIPQGVDIIEYLSESNANITSVSFPDSLTVVSKKAFKNCKSLSEIILPDTVTTLGDDAFFGCTGLKQVRLSSNIESFGVRIFRGCSALESVNIPDGLTELPNATFYGCSSLKSIELNDNITKIGNSAFLGCSTIEEINLPSKLETIGNSAFKNCTNIKSIIIPDSVTSMVTMSFYGCTSLTNAVIGSGISKITKSCFYGCTALSNLYLSDSVTEIDNSAFYNCSKLATIDGAKNVKVLRDNAFYGCTALEDCDFFNKLTWLGPCAFRGCENITSVTIPYTYSDISYSSFYNCKSLKKVVIVGDVKYIDDFAFAGCNKLEEINLPSTLETIGKSAFQECFSLRNIGGDIPSGVTSIGEYAFYEVPLSGNITIPNGISEIGKSSFYHSTGITSIIIPTSVTSIDEFAFSRVNGLSDIYYMGTEAQWKEITIGANNSRFLQATIHYLGEEHTHSYTESITILPSCSNFGVKTYTCQCGDSYTEEISKLSHTEETIPAVAATCTSQGLTEGKKCSTCGEIIVAQTATAKASHTESAWITDTKATCKSAGTKYTECTVCHTTINKGSIEKLNHTEETIPAVAATCTSQGLTEGKKCSVCGEIIVAQTATAKASHTESAWITDTEATCKSAGTKHTECTACHTTINTSSIEKLNHTEETIPTVAATCTSQGLTEGKKCSTCGEIIVAQTATAKASHTESAWITDTKATCKSAGTKHTECTVCHTTINTSSIEKLNHTEETIPAVAATCTSQGLTEGKKCSTCGEIIVAQTLTAKASHTESAWITDTKATCKAAGTKHTECTVCHTTISTGEISKLNHTEEAIPAVAATCTSQGLTEGKKCSTCGEIIVAQTLTAKVSHTESTWITDTKATCKSAGAKHTECTVCYTTISTGEISKLNHKEEIVPAVAATCTSQGLTEGKKCSVCGEIIVAQTLTAKASHTESAWITDTKATCKSVGTKHTECTVCHTTINTSSIEKLNHTEEIVLAVAATCTSQGLTEGKKCSVCGEIIVAQTATAKASHIESAWITDTEATCKSVGTKHTECTVCHTTISTGEISKLNHKEETIPAVAATCTSQGLTEGKKCSTCGEIIVAQTSTAKASHTESAWITDTKATCKTAGTKHTECTACHTTISTGEISKLNHKEEIVPAVAATCTSQGLTEGKKCSVCGEMIIVQKSTEKTSHKDTDGDNRCDECQITIDVTKDCSCDCHKSGFSGFIWKIRCFFYKIFGINKTCSCSVEHY